MSHRAPTERVNNHVRNFCIVAHIDHGNGLQSMYAHNSRLLVSGGEVVKKGQQIALVGSTGFATGPHVHYQLELWGKPVDPTPYLSGSVKLVALTP